MVLTMLTVLLIAGVWAVALAMGPAVCSAVFPADPTCFQDGRIAIAATATGALVALTVAAFLILPRAAGRWVGVFVGANIAVSAAVIAVLA